MNEWDSKNVKWVKREDPEKGMDDVEYKNTHVLDASLSLSDKPETLNNQKRI